MSIRWNPYIYAGANLVNNVDPSGNLFGAMAVVAGGVILNAISQATSVPVSKAGEYPAGGAAARIGNQRRR